MQSQDTIKSDPLETVRSDADERVSEPRAALSPLARAALANGVSFDDVFAYESSARKGQVLSPLWAAILLTFSLGGCFAQTAESKPEAPACAPVKMCETRTDGYAWASLQTSKVGDCSFYRFACLPDGGQADDSCEQRWETVCAPGVDSAGGGE